MGNWTPRQIYDVANEIENFIMDQIKNGNLSSKIETGNLWSAAQYGMDALGSAACALRDHITFLRNQENHTEQKG